MNSVFAHDAQQAGIGLAELSLELQQARREAAENKEKYLRLLADQENYRKRLQRVYEDRLQDSKSRFLLKLLEVSDNLERALSYADPADPLSNGVKMTYEQLRDVLAEEGVEVMQTVGQSFDAQWHEAVEIVPGDGPDKVVDSEVLKGYLYQGRLLRPAQVRVRQNSQQP